MYLAKNEAKNKYGFLNICLIHANLKINFLIFEPKQMFWVLKSNQKKKILISQPKHMLWLLKRTVSMKQMLKILGKKKFTILR